MMVKIVLSGAAKVPLNETLILSSLWCGLYGAQVLLLMRNLSINLSSPEFEEHVSMRERMSADDGGH